MRFFTDGETRKYLGIESGETGRGGFTWSGTNWVRTEPGLSTTYYLTADGRSRYWMARAMVGLLMAQVEGGTVGESVVLPNHLVVRASA